MQFSSLAFGSALRFPPSRHFASQFMRRPWSLPEAPLSRRFLRLYAPKSSVLINERRTVPPPYLSSLHQRGYVTSSRSRISGRIGSIIGKFMLFAGLYVAVLVAAEIWYSLRPPQLSEWPEEVRVHLVQARSSCVLETEDVLDHFRSAWTAIQNIPTVALMPDPVVKILTIAIWFADHLEKGGRDREAYQVLSDAIALLQTRLSNSSGGPRSEGRADDNTLERRYVISVLSKLATLSGKYDPSAEVKWLSRAVREMIELIPLCNGLSTECCSNFFAQLQRLSVLDSSFADLSLTLGSLYKAKRSSASTAEPADVWKPNSNIPENEVIPDDGVLYLPYWFCPDVASAIAVPIEKIGAFAEKEGHKDLAWLSYDVAVEALLTSIPSSSIEEATFPFWQALIRVLQVLNRKTGLILRELETEIHPTEWLHHLHYAFIESGHADMLLWEITVVLNAKLGSWKRLGHKLPDTLLMEMDEIALALSQKAVCMETLGKFPDAMRFYEEAMKVLQVTVQKQPWNVKEIKNMEERLTELKRRAVEGKTSIESHMNPKALKEWEEMQRESRNKGVDESPKS